MYEMIIADDEPVILEGISRMLDYKAMNINIAARCSDGESLLHAARTSKCNIIISDVAMPKMNGIDVLKRLHDDGLNISVIFISGFSDFEYARDAVRYGAVDYITKPVKKDDLENAVRKAIELQTENENSQPIQLINTDAQNTSSKPIDNSMDKRFDNYTVMNIYMHDYEGIQEEELLRLSVAEKTEKFLEGTGIVFTKGKYVCAVVGHSENDDAYIRRRSEAICEMLKKETKRKVSILLGGTVNKMSSIPQAYECAAKLEKYVYYSDSEIIGREFVQQKQKNDYTDLENLECSLRKALTEHDDGKFSSDIVRTAKEVCAVTYGNAQLTKSYLISLIKMVQRSAREYLSDGKDSIAGICEAAAKKISVSERFSDDRKILEVCLFAVREMLAAQNTQLPDEIIMAKEYILKHFSENITLEIVAGKVFMNPFYFSTFFKKHMKVNFKDYLSTIRLNNAKKLLIGTNKRISDIAEQMGFKNARNFNKVFKTAYGTTPAEFRKNR